MQPAAGEEHMFIRRYRVLSSQIGSILHRDLKSLEIAQLSFDHPNVQREFTTALFSHEGLRKVSVQSKGLPSSIKLHRFVYTRYGLFLKELELASKFDNPLTISLLAAAFKFNQHLTKFGFERKNGEEGKSEFLRLMHNATRLKSFEITSSSCLSTVDFLAAASLVRCTNQMERFRCGIFKLPDKGVVEEKLLFAAVERSGSLKFLDDTAIDGLSFRDATSFKKQLLSLRLCALHFIPTPFRTPPAFRTNL